MRVSVPGRWACALGLLLVNPTLGVAAPPAPTPAQACRTETIEGSVEAGQSFARAIGNGLLLVLQPIHSGWILRVLPASTRPADVGQPGFHDYAELATPPYQSVTPLSLSTDFAFRAQDAVGWNPRRFRFADSQASYARLLAAYNAFERANPQAAGSQSAGPPSAGASELAAEVARAADGVFTILDSRLAPGTADQGAAAAAVSANFPSTAHTLVLAPAIEASPLGKLLGLSFRVQLELPPGFRAEPGMKVVNHLCGTR